jgi:hypothetical protein
MFEAEEVKDMLKLGMDELVGVGDLMLGRALGRDEDQVRGCARSAFIRYTALDSRTLLR